jgi:hypothetical protein
MLTTGLGDVVIVQCESHSVDGHKAPRKNGNLMVSNCEIYIAQTRNGVIEELNLGPGRASTNASVVLRGKCEIREAFLASLPIVFIIGMFDQAARHGTMSIEKKSIEARGQTLTQGPWRFATGSERKKCCQCAGSGSPCTGDTHK